MRPRSLLFFAASWISAQGATTTLDGLYALVERRIPSHSQSFNFTLTPNAAEYDSFTLSDSLNVHGNSTVHVECNSVSACARGLYTYLTKFGGVDIWWTGSRLNALPKTLPCVGTPLTQTSIVKYRYFFNTVTFSYTTAFYTFQDWELLLDWMALRGINLPLAWVGYEHVLIEVFRDAGLSDSVIRAFLSGPAFQAWNRLGNIQGSWGGELPMQWVEDQSELQKKLVPRMVELGMTPVMPCFTGFVPPALATLYPNASIVLGGQWDGFPSEYTNDSFLDPLDPLFTTLQTSFIKKQKALYGDVSHIYTLDQYNENDPYSGDVSYLQNVSSGTFASLRAADPEAVWMMQGWMFFSSETFWTPDRVQAYLGGVPGNDSLIILDLYSEAQPQWQRLDAYSGKPWIWCELHNFGGNMGMEGNFVNVTAAPIDALATVGNGSMIGMGLTPEGLDLGNEIVYDVLLDQAWSPTAINRTEYVTGWVSRRYNVRDLPSVAVDAWQLLASTVYNNQDPDTQATVKSIFELAPALSGLVNRTGHHPTMVFYDTQATIAPALQMLIDARSSCESLVAIPEFQFDLVDWTRQMLANKFIGEYEYLVSVFNSTNNASASAIKHAGQSPLALVNDIDELLGTNPFFSLATEWLGPAQRWARGNKSYEAYLDSVARNQITLWGPTGQINDYASKQWAGLVGGYYAPRWNAFVGYLAGLKQNGTVYDDGALTSELLAIGEGWGKAGPVKTYGCTDADGEDEMDGSDEGGDGSAEACVDADGEDGLEDDPDSDVLEMVVKLVSAYA